MERERESTFNAAGWRNGIVLDRFVVNGETVDALEVSLMAIASHTLARRLSTFCGLGRLVFFLFGLPAFIGPVPAAAQTMPTIRVSANLRDFVEDGYGRSFIPWGVNYDHDENGRLLEDYWETEWSKVVQDFHEIKDLGANVVRIHLQLGKFMLQPDVPNDVSLNRLTRLVNLVERLQLYLDVTGLGCYHKADVPAWYNVLSEEARWGVQARFWEAVAQRCARSPAVFCYDLMNEPVVPGKEKETEWLAGEFAGSYFVQRISLDLAGRTQKQVAKAWVNRLVASIRKQDRRHLVTVGVIPWALTFPGAQPLFYSREVAERLDFASVHFYPESGKINQALTALAVYDIGKPLVVEEMFPLKSSVQELEAFVDGSRRIADGWLGFYWGKTIEECRASGELADALTAGWLEFFQRKARMILPSQRRTPRNVRVWSPGRG